MSTMVLLRWILPVGHPYESARESIAARITPAVRGSGWLSGPDTTHHVSDQGTEAWLTVVTRLDDVTDVRDELDELLMSRPAIESTDDRLLAPAAETYRAALQGITHVGLDVLEARGTIPLSEYGAFASPSESTPLLIPFLNEVSPTYRRACSSYESTERFWLTFFRRGPVPDFSAPGHWLWNLAG